ncbi:uncharacterized protein YkwD [Alkalihalobacillus xiaoxiensis]|uniref:Uncharacterized protein YkwD n=1 Tax=Shouchella xiaoxiensis TaxID=766895 RepID=A0ABS2SPT5_9BACI|nr:CAP domain-containing protein [Shouchella xiaoxiensis]MBM7837527.1 uncharacterized protein YkwD [Shouchella xiaoxiensis]
MIKRILILLVLSVISVVLFNEYNQIPSKPVNGTFISAKQSPLFMSLKEESYTYPNRFANAEETSQPEEDEPIKEEHDADHAAESTINLGALMEGTSEEIRATLGEPDRKDPSAFGYESWIYNQFEDGYVQVAIQQGEVVSIVASGTPISGFLGNERASYSELSSLFTFEDNVPVETSAGTFTFRLTDQDQSMRPLTQVGDYWLQLYMDVHTDELSTIRLMNADVLLMQKPYSLSYTGNIPERPVLSEDAQKKVEQANEQQIFEHTNHIRKHHELNPFEWSEEVSNVAYLHSLDMHDQQFFDHISPGRGNLADRFNEGAVEFKVAGENIALKYVDGVAAVEGWLNSEGHRVNLLHQEYHYLGVGVYDEYYTQNFLKP